MIVRNVSLDGTVYKFHQPVRVELVKTADGSTTFVTIASYLDIPDTPFASDSYQKMFELPEIKNFEQAERWLIASDDYQESDEVDEILNGLSEEQIAILTDRLNS